MKEKTCNNIWSIGLENIECVPEVSVFREIFYFYANNFEKFKNVIESLTDDALCVKKLKQLVQDNAVKCGLAFIKLHLSELCTNLKN